MKIDLQRYVNLNGIDISVNDMDSRLQLKRDVE